MQKEYKVQIIGMGGGNPDHMTRIAYRKMLEADTLLGASRHLDIPPNNGKKKIYMDDGLKELAAYIQKHHQEEQLVVLVSGDPGFHSLLRYLKNQLDQVSFEVYGGVGSISMLFNRLSMLWDDAYLMSLHGQTEDVIQAVRAHGKVALLTDATHTPAKIVGLLRDAGVRNKRIVVGENLSYQDERIIETDLESESDIGKIGMAVMVICDEDIQI